LQESGKISPDAIWIFRYPLPELLLFPTPIPPRVSPVPEIVADPAIFCRGRISGNGQDSDAAAYKGKQNAVPHRDR
jgi:hypothetical protein